ncbi:MAG: hypothetical protein H7644_11010 [Candidatus Heimdallarchaeota archaeon]|nr:hypothetical protein [Candidatus Heimdallarchaeota archaeon]MCK5144287.1 hypothetical protein [Candidatus Heimdallarchaeota archaeon]
MSTTMSLKIPEELREKMRKLKDQVEWSKEIREYIQKRIREIEGKKKLEEVHEMIKKTSSSPLGTARKIVREERDSH